MNDTRKSALLSFSYWSTNSAEFLDLFRTISVFPSSFLHLTNVSYRSRDCSSEIRETHTDKYYIRNNSDRSQRIGGSLFFFLQKGLVKNLRLDFYYGHRARQLFPARGNEARANFTASLLSRAPHIVGFCFQRHERNDRTFLIIEHFGKLSTRWVQALDDALGKPLHREEKDRVKGQQTERERERS